MGISWIFSNENKPTQIVTRTQRNVVWSKYHGTSLIGTCYCCSKIISKYNYGWHCSHVIAIAKGGSCEINNLRVCCPNCNLKMGNQNIYAYIRDNKLRGPGAFNMNRWFMLNPLQISDTMTKK